VIEECPHPKLGEVWVKVPAAGANSPNVPAFSPGAKTFSAGVGGEFR